MSDPNYLKEPAPFDIEEFHHTYRHRIRMLVLTIIFLAVGCVCSVVYAFVQRSKIERILNASETQRDYSKEAYQASEEKIRMLEQQITTIMKEAEAQRKLAQQFERALHNCKLK